MTLTPPFPGKRIRRSSKMRGTIYEKSLSPLMIPDSSAVASLTRISGHGHHHRHHLCLCVFNHNLLLNVVLPLYVHIVTNSLSLLLQSKTNKPWGYNDELLIIISYPIFSIESYVSIISAVSRFCNQPGNSNVCVTWQQRNSSRDYEDSEAAAGID